MRRLQLRRLVVVSVAALLFALLNVPAALAQPANDDFDTPTVVGGLPFTDSISTVDATAAADDPSCTSSEHSVWYSFTPTQDGSIRVDTSRSDYNTALGVYTGSRGALSEVACASLPGVVTFNATTNTTYFFMVASFFGGPGGTLVFDVIPPPANDDFGNPTVISALPFADSISTVAATAAADDPSCSSNEHSVWYSFTPTQDTPIRADTAGSDYSTALGVYTGSRGALSEVACEFFGGQVAFNASANTTYFFMIAGAFGGPGGNLVFRVNPPPANDDFDSATVAPALPFTDSVFTGGATTAADDPSCVGNEHTVWYSFTPTRDMPIRADTAGSDYTTSLGVYTGSRGALSEVACASSPARVIFSATANTTYFFMVAGAPGGTLVFNVTEGPPPNDEIGGATPLTLNTPVTQDTTLATSSPTDPTTCSFGEAHNTVWFSFTPTESRPLNLARSGSYNGRLSVLTDLGGGPVVIACGFGAGVRFDATAGRTYFFMDSGFFEGGGQLQLTLSPGIVMTVAADPTGTVSRSGTAVVSGTLACNPAAPPQGGAGSPTLDIVLRQKISKTLVIQGRNFLEIPCPTTPTAWSVTIIGDNGPFRKGRAEVFVTGFACDQVACASPELRQTIRLNWE